MKGKRLTTARKERLERNTKTNKCENKNHPQEKYNFTGCIATSERESGRAPL